MPCDSPDSVDDFQFYLGKTHSLIEDHPSSLACILGDFNAINTDPSIKYILDNGYVTNQSNIKETNPFGTIIDHIFLSKKFVQNYKSYKILSYPYVWSDHNAIILIIEDFF